MSRLITTETAPAYCQWLFAPWIMALDPQILHVEQGEARVRFPNRPDLRFALGPLCGQAQMAMIDTVMTLAIVSLTEDPVAATVNQNTSFLRPALAEDLICTCRVLRDGQRLIYGEAHITQADSGRLLTHATVTFAKSPPGGPDIRPDP